MDSFVSIIDDAADALHAALKRGERPPLEGLLSEVVARHGSEIRAPFLQVLIAVEVHGRRTFHDEQPTLSEYLARFPEDSRAVESAFCPDPAELNAELAKLIQPLSVPRSGKLFDRFLVLKELGRGGLGVVFLVRDTHADTESLEMALKVPYVHSADSMAWRSLSVLEEARKQGLCRAYHPGIVRVFDVKCPDLQATLSDEELRRQFRDSLRANPELWISMEFVSGGSLHDRLRQGPVPPREAVEMMVDIADALETAHGQGIVHRDLKPANILLAKRPDGTVLPKISDFGLAVAYDDQEFGDRAGTLAYMAPEQIQGGDVRPASDVWSLGVMLFEMLTGKRPFPGGNREEIAARIIRHRGALYPRGLQEGKHIDQALSNLCERALNPDKRFQNAADFAEALREWLKQGPTGTISTSEHDRTPSPPEFRPRTRIAPLDNERQQQGSPVELCDVLSDETSENSLSTHISVNAQQPPTLPEWEQLPIRDRQLTRQVLSCLRKGSFVGLTALVEGSQLQSSGILAKSIVHFADAVRKLKFDLSADNPAQLSHNLAACLDSLRDPETLYGVYSRTLRELLETSVKLLLLVVSRPSDRQLVLGQVREFARLQKDDLLLRELEKLG